MITRLACLAIALVVVPTACAGPRAGDAEDAAMAIDSTSGGVDAAIVDAAIDAGGRDAATAVDALIGPDATWGSCMFGGVTGTCVSVSACAGMPRMGLCPGPSDIQCCLPTSDAGPMPDAFRTGTVTPAQVLARLGACNRIGGDYAIHVGAASTVPICQTANVVWWDADMDIDCDGGRSALCRSDPAYMASTSAVDSRGAPLDASTLPFIVIPLPSTRWRFANSGIALGQVALVLYNNRMAFGIFGDEGPSAIIGEASFAMAEALGIPSNPITGGVGSGVTYVVFTGPTARVTRNEDHAEAVRIGTSLLNAFVP